MFSNSVRSATIFWGPPKILRGPSPLYPLFLFPVSLSLRVFFTFYRIFSEDFMITGDKILKFAESWYSRCIDIGGHGSGDKKRLCTDLKNRFCK